MVDCLWFIYQIATHKYLKPIIKPTESQTIDCDLYQLFSLQL